MTYVNDNRSSCYVARYVHTCTHLLVLRFLMAPHACATTAALSLWRISASIMRATPPDAAHKQTDTDTDIDTDTDSGTDTDIFTDTDNDSDIDTDMYIHTHARTRSNTIYLSISQSDQDMLACRHALYSSWSSCQCTWLGVERPHAAAFDMLGTDIVESHRRNLGWSGVRLTIHNGALAILSWLLVAYQFYCDSVSGEHVKPEILAALSDAAALDAADWAIAFAADEAVLSSSRMYSQGMHCQSHGKVLPQVM